MFPDYFCRSLQSECQAACKILTDDQSVLGLNRIPTPLGTYNPDWAVLVVDNDGEEKLYFVVETKASNWWDDLRHKEGAKIKCGEKHFAVLATGENPAKYIKTNNVNGMLEHS